jgi:hypothetical protein
MSPAEEEEEEDLEEGQAESGGAVAAPAPTATSLGVMLPSFGLTPPEEEGLKTTDGILKVGCNWTSTGTGPVVTISIKLMHILRN